MRVHTSNSGLSSWRLSAVLTALALLITACSGASAATATGAAAAPTTLAQKKKSSVSSTIAAVLSQTPLPQTTPTEAATTAPTMTQAAPTQASGTVSFPVLQHISMEDADTGWGLSQDAVFYTTDGGRDWKNITPQSGWLAQSIVKGFFLNASTAWVIQPAEKNFDTGTLYHTEDGGQSWEATKVPFGPNPLHFLNANDGWVMADRGAAAGSMGVDIYKTTDGGTSWTKVQSAGPETQDTPGALPFGGDKSGMAFKDMRDGWIGGFQPIIDHSYLYRTTDGGNTWTFQNLTIPAAFSSSSVLTLAPKFFTNQEGMLPVSLEMQVQSIDFYVTHDGGQTWQSTAVVQNQEAYDIVSMQDIRVWSKNTLKVTHDGAQNWTSITPVIALQGKIQQLDFINQKTGWAISMDIKENMHLYQTQDSGKTWNQLSK